MKTKITKESRNLLIGMLLGDGTISNNYVYKIAHAESQKDYLEWKVKQLKEAGIRNTGVKSYIKTKGYNINVPVFYTQLNIIPFIKVLRRVVYKGKKILGNRKLLNRLSAKELAIWYMDDGHINYRKYNGKIVGIYIKISTCEPKEEVQTIIDYFKEKWNINFYMFHEVMYLFLIILFHLFCCLFLLYNFLNYNICQFDLTLFVLNFLLIFHLQF